MRIRLIAVAAFLPIALGAQQQRATSVAQTFLGFGVPYGYYIVTALDSIPESKYNFKPTPPQQTIGYIAQHLESANYGLCNRFGGTTRVMTARDSLADTIKAKWPKDTLVARVRASLEFCGKVIRTLDDASLAEQIPIWCTGVRTDRAAHATVIALHHRPR